MNTEILTTYWNIGRIIVEHKQNSEERAEYEQQTLKELSKILDKNFSWSDLQTMRAFYFTYLKIPDTVWQIDKYALRKKYVKQILAIK